MLSAAKEDFATCYLDQSIEALHAFRTDSEQIATLSRITEMIVTSMKAYGKLLVAGNGGSAGDAQHIAAEFTGRMLYNRDPLPAVALSTDTSALTAIANDYGFDKVFERQVIALGRPGDVLLVLSTSGNSANVLCALDAARACEMTTVGFAGSTGGQMIGRADLVLRAPSEFTPIIQQVHMVAAHIVCSLVEQRMFPRES